MFGIDAVRHELQQHPLRHRNQPDHRRHTNVILGEVLPVRDFPNCDSEEFGVFWQDEITLGPDWSIMPGLRWENSRTRGEPDADLAAPTIPRTIASTDNDAFTPKLGLRWSGDRLVELPQYAHGYRAPPFADVNIGLNLPAFNYVALPNPDLKPERSRGLELGLRFGGEFAQASLALFDNRFEDLIESRANLGVNEDGQLVFQSVNRDSARIVGVEFEARLGLDAFWAVGRRLASAGLGLLVEGRRDNPRPAC